MKKIQLKSKMKRRYDFLNIQDMTTDKVLSRDLNLNGCDSTCEDAISLLVYYNTIIVHLKWSISNLGGWNISL